LAWERVLLPAVSRLVPGLWQRVVALEERESVPVQVSQAWAEQQLARIEGQREAVVVTAG